MAYSYEDFTGDGATTDFAVNKPYLDEAHITLLEDGVSVGFTFVNAALIRADVAPLDTLNVRVKRTTPINAALVDYINGSTLVDTDLDTTTLQMLYNAQEIADDAADNLRVAPGLTAWDAESEKIINLGTPTLATDAVTKEYVDAITVAAGNVPTPSDPADDAKILTAASGLFTWSTPVVQVPDIVTDVTPQAGGDFDMNSKFFGLSRGSNIAGGTELDIDTATGGNHFDVTGSGATINTITAPPVGSAAVIYLVFAGVNTLAHSGSFAGETLYLPTGANITTAAFDSATFIYRSGYWICSSYSRADGTGLVSGAEAATQAAMEAGTATTVSTVVTPGRQHFHPAHAKVVCTVSMESGTPVAVNEHNVASYTDNGTGDVTVNFTTAFSSAAYTALTSMAEDSTPNVGRFMTKVYSKAAGSVRCIIYTETVSAGQDMVLELVCFGDHT